MLKERKRALLVVAGGRGTPEFAALHCIKPHLVVIVTSYEGWGSEEQFRAVAELLPDQEPIPPTIHVKSYSFEETEQRCLQVCEAYPPTLWDWTFSITSCPKIMGIAAYEVARRMSVPCISIDMNHELIVSLKHTAKFLGTGDWLEVYAWQEAKRTGIMSDCQWGYCIRSTAKNELDVACTYKAQFVFAECKTDGKPFSTKYLEDINSKAEMLGRNYTTKIFVTNGSKTLPGYRNFAEQAKLRRVVVATAEDLPTLKDVLEKQAKNPDYPRT